MPTLRRAASAAEQAALREVYLSAEARIINEIARLRGAGNVDYHAVAALERVQRILAETQTAAGEYVPRMVEREFYVKHPEARRIPETVEKHRAGYTNAEVLTATQTDIVERLVMNLLGQLEEASATVQKTLENGLLGRTTPDKYRSVGLSTVSLMQATGEGSAKAAKSMVEQLRRDGVTAFVDRAGRKWSLHTYADMVCRTTARQAEVLALLTRDPEQDLYKISSHGTTCPICAPLEGRVYSRSGTDPDFPPLSLAFGKVDPDGGDDLANTWLNIHPNCLHALIPWTPAGRSDEEIEQIKKFSSPRTNPLDRDPRSQAQIDAYRKKEQARAAYLRSRRQWERYKTALGDGMPSFETFLKHKTAGSEKYKTWMAKYRKSLDNSGGHDIMSLAEGLERGQISLTINSEKQNRHIRGTAEYIEGRSYLAISLDEAQEIVNRYHGKGEMRQTRNGTWAKKEQIMTDRFLGVSINPNTGVESPTRAATIHYSKTGTHLVPRKEDDAE